MAIVESLLHLDKYLGVIIKEYGAWAYLILFLIIFLETGIVLTPFLPGDSLLFAAGAFAATGAFDVSVLLVLLAAAAIAGDSLNYKIGSIVGPRIFQKETVRFLKKEHLDRTHRFYEKYGGKTIILARFVPIVRTFAPFVAGIGRMRYSHFLSYNVLGGVFWIATFILGGYFFGNLQVVKENFTFVILGIIAISVLPGLIEFVRHRKAVKALL